MKTDSTKPLVFTVHEETELMAFLQKCFNGISRSKLKSMFSARRIEVDGRQVSQFDFALTPGMKVTVSRGARKSEFRSRWIDIVYEDKWLVVINKHEGLLSNSPVPHKATAQTILNDYFRQSGQRCSAHVVHRLDRDTSGLMIFCKDKQTELMFESDWKGYVYDRRYVALVNGVLPQDSGTVESWLADNKACFTVSSPTDNGGKYAVTHYEVVRRSDTHTLVELKLDTGRKNQIRVHMQTLGCPVVGDIKYGRADDDSIPRLCLHAFRLCFTHPVTHQRMEFETPYPPSFKQVF